MKTDRHQAIIDMIEHQSVQTQEEIAAYLRELGFQVTQATVSRDIKELKLIKIPAKEGGYQYSMPDRTETTVADRLIRMLSDSMLSVNYAGNMIVVKTISGSANIAAEAIDNMEWPEIIGTLAGDNTIFLVIRDGTDVAEVADKIENMIRN